MSDDFSGILVEDETVVWTGQPDMAAGDRPNRWQAFRINLIWMTGGLAAGSLILWFATRPDNAVFLTVVYVFLLIFAAAAVFVAIVNMWTYRHYDRSDERYVLTDRRLISFNPKTGEQMSVFPNGQTTIFVRKNGKVHDLTISYAFDGEDRPSLTLWAISDAASVKRQFLNLLHPPTKDTP